MDSRPVSWYGVTFFRGNDGKCQHNPALRNLDPTLLDTGLRRYDGYSKDSFRGNAEWVTYFMDHTPCESLRIRFLKNVATSAT